MTIRLHRHALERLSVRGVTTEEVVATVSTGESLPAKHGRTRFTRTFECDAEWLGKRYATKTIDASAVFEDGDWLVITVIAKFGGRTR